MIKGPIPAGWAYLIADNNRGYFDEIMGKIIYRTKTGLVKAKDYRGVLYVGIMLTQDGPKALEFNVRFE